MPAANSQLRFHPVHGKYIEVYENRTRARRSHSYFNGITFSDRPIHPMESVHIKFLEIKQDTPFHTIQVGFTHRDPNQFGNALPVRAPSLINQNSNFWTFPFETYSIVKGKVLSFYFTPTGSVHSVFGDFERHEFEIPSQQQSLWAVVDLFGTCTDVEFLDMRANNPIPRLRLNQPIPQPPLDDSQFDEGACKICYQRAMDAAVIECGHAMCYDCAEKLKRQKALCPFCRAKIIHVLRIYEP